MKRKLVFLILLTVSTMQFAKAQLIPNAGFETWTNLILFEEAQGYVSTNYVSIILGTGLPRANVFKSTDKHSGTRALKMESYGQNTGDTVGIPGGIVTGVLDLANSAINPGFPYSGRPSEVRGFYKYAHGPKPDSALASVILRKFNSVSGEAEVVGGGVVLLGNAANYTSFSIPIIYTGALEADTAILAFSTTQNFSFDTSALFSAPVDAVLFLDDLSFYETSTGINEPIDQLLSRLYSYPNPAEDRMTISFDSKTTGMGSIRVFNLMGQQIDRKIVEIKQGLNQLTYETQNMYNGCYYYQLELGNKLHTQKFEVIR